MKELQGVSSLSPEEEEEEEEEEQLS